MTEAHKPLRFAFAGFRHDHILGLHTGVQESAFMKIVACGEEHAQTREALARKAVVTITHTNLMDMLDHVECDVVAIGDYFGRRGSLIIECLKRGKHVIADKPVCTHLSELEEIERLTSARGLSLGCQLDMRDNGQMIKVRELVLNGAIGEIHAITFGGQHPLMPNTRPGWYFEEGKHGGTINDIGIHAFDIIPWLTGLSFDSIIAARSWNALTKEFPHMRDAGQFMLRLSNGCGVLGDVSYLMPGAMGYDMEQCWRMTLWGSKGIIETSATSDHVLLATTADQRKERISPSPSLVRGYLEAFRQEIRGCSPSAALRTHDVIAASLALRLPPDHRAGAVLCSSSW